ncbi:MAG: hypothetical protein EA398_12885 [Deltaproteobacteria bacterium]|nr:MAG: hypothetical protein EA398_12885 [Deltaproteobacteria bacterium]
MDQQITDVIAALRREPDNAAPLDDLAAALAREGRWDDIERVHGEVAVELVGVVGDVWPGAVRRLKALRTALPKREARADASELIARIERERLDNPLGEADALQSAWEFDPRREHCWEAARRLLRERGEAKLECTLLERRAEIVEDSRERVLRFREVAEWARAQGPGLAQRARLIDERADHIEAALAHAPTMPPTAGKPESSDEEEAEHPEEIEQPTRPMEVEAATGIRPAASREAIPPKDEVASLRARLVDREAAEREASRVRELLERSPHDPAVLAAHARVLELRGDLQAAADELDKACRRVGSGPLQEPLFETLGVLCWKGLQDSQRASQVFRKLKVLNRRNATMLGFFAEQEEQSEDWRRLFTTLGHLRDATEDAGERLAVARRMAMVAEHRLESPDRAAEVWKGVLRDHPGDTDARDELKRLLESAGRWNALLEVLREQIEGVERSATGEARVEQLVSLHREVIRICQEHVHQPVMVNAAWAAILDVDPGHAEAVEALAERYESTGRWNELSRILEERARLTRDEEEAAALWHRVAAIRRERLQNPVEAAQALEALLEIVPDEQAALDALEEIHRSREDHAGLLRVEERRILSLPTAERVARLLDMAHRAEEELQDGQTAMGFHRRVLEMLPEHEGADAHLERLVRSTGDEGALIGFLRERLLRRSSFESATAAELAALLVGKGEEAEEEAETLWTEILDIEPDHAEAEASLRAMWTRAGRWDAIEGMARERDALGDLVRDWLRDSASRADGRLDRALSIVSDELDEPSLERSLLDALLVERPGDRELLGRLDRVLQRPGMPAEDRLPVLQQLLEGTSDAEERVVRMIELGAYCLEALSEPEMAWRWYAEAVTARPHDASLRERAGDVAAQAGESKALFHILKRQAAELGRGARQTELHRWLAEYASGPADQPSEAILFRERVLEQAPGDRESLAALQLLYREAEDWAQLVRVLDLDAESGGEDTAWESGVFAAEITLRELGDAADALARLGRLADRHPDRSGLAPLRREALDALGRTAEVMQELAEERERTADPAERTVLDLERGLLGLRSPETVDEAVGVLAGVEDTALSAPMARRVSEALLGTVRSASEQSEAAGLLVRAGRLSGDASLLSQALDLVLSLDSVVGEEQLLVERALLVADRLERPQEALDGLLARAMDDERGEAFWDAVESLAERLGRGLDAARVMREAGEEHVSPGLLVRHATLLDRAGASPMEVIAGWRSVLDCDPFDEAALGALEQLLEGRGDDGLLVDVLVRLAGLGEPAERFARLRRAADLASESLGDLDRAVAIYRNLQEEFPEDPSIVDDVEELLLGAGRVQELADFLAESARRSGAVARKSALLRARAGLLETRLGDVSGALAVYRELLDLTPDDPEVQGHLERLAIETGEGEALLGILSTRLSEVTGAEASRIRVRMARLHLEAGESDMAAEAALAALAESSEHAGALDVLEKAWPGLPEGHPVRSGAAAPLATSARVSGRYELLAEVLRFRLSERSVEPRDGWTELAALYEDHLERPRDAAQSWREVVRIDPCHEVAWRGLERLSTHTGDHGIYAEALDEALDWPGLDTTWRAGLLLRRALLAELDGSVERAAYMLSEAAKCSPEQVEVARAYARVLAKRSEYAGLVELLERGAELLDDREEQVAWLSGAARLCLVALNDRSRAVELLQRVFALDPTSESVTGLLASTLEVDERWEDVGQLLEHRLTTLGGGAPRVNGLLELAYLYRTRVHDLRRSWSFLEKAVAEGPGHVAVVEEGVRLHAAAIPSGVPGLSAAVAVPILKRAQELDAGGKAVELAVRHVLGVGGAELTASPLAEDVRAAVEVLSANASSRVVWPAWLRLVRHGVGAAGSVTAAEGHADTDAKRIELAEVLLESGCDPSIDAGVRRDALLWVGRVVGDAAEGRVLVRKAMEEAVTLDPEDEAVAAAVDAWLGGDADEQEAVRFLEVQLDRAQDVTGRRRLSHRLADLLSGALADPVRAAEVLRQQLVQDPDDAETIERLVGLNRGIGDWEAVAALLEDWVGCTADPDERRALCLELSSVRMEELDDAEGAEVALELGVRDDREDLMLLDALARVQEEAGRPEDAVATLDRIVGALEGEPPGTRAPFVVRAMTITCSALDDPARGFGLAVTALRDGASEQDVAPALLPVLTDGYVPGAELGGLVAWAVERVGLTSPLVTAVLERALREERDESAQVELLVQLAEHAGAREEGEERAFELLAQAIVLRPGDVSLLERLVGFARALGQLERCVDVLEQVRTTTSDPGRTRSLALRQASLCLELGDRLDDGLAALADYDPATDADVERLLREMSERPSVGRAATGRLEPVYREQGDQAGVRAALEARLEQSTSPAERAGILVELAEAAEAREERFDYLCAAFGMESSSVPVRRLVELTEDEGEVMRVVALLQDVASEVQGQEASAREMLMEAARLQMERLDDPEGALEALMDARKMGDDVRVEEMLREAARRGASIEPWVHEELLRSAADRAEATAERHGLLLERASLLYGALEDPVGAVGAAREVLDDEPGHEEAWSLVLRLLTELEDWDELVQVLEDRADWAESDADRIALSRQRVDILRDELDDAPRAAAVLRDVVTSCPAEEWAWSQFESILVQLGEVAELQDVLLSRLGVLEGGRERAEVFLRLGRNALDGLGQPEAAVGYLEHAAEAEETRERSLEILRRLHAEAGDWYGVVDVLERQEEREVGPWLEAASELLTTVRDLAASRSAHEVVLALEPGQPDAVVGLLRIAREQGDSQAAGALLSDLEAGGAWEAVLKDRDPALLAWARGDEESG